MPHVAVVLAGCGHRDGAEVREACFTLLALDQQRATFQCFAPDKPQAEVIDHRTGEPVPGETRNVLVESARIARGDIRPLSEFDADAFDALVFPGGTGCAKNLSDFAAAGAAAVVDAEVQGVVRAMQAASKPMGFVCVTPVAVAAPLLNGARLTIGSDVHPAAAAVEATGNTHVGCLVTEAIADDRARVVSTPAYMEAEARPAEVFEGISALVREVLAMIGR